MQIISMSLTLACSLFSYAFLGCFSWLSVTKVLILVMAVFVFSTGSTLDITSISVRSKTVRRVSGLSFFHQDIPIVGAIADVGWKQSSLKCFHTKSYA